MQALSGSPTTRVEQVTELGDGIGQKLVTAGITTVEALGGIEAPSSSKRFRASASRLWSGSR